MLSPGNNFLSKYDVLKQIGEGGMSKVFLAKDVSLGKLWAIKEIDKTSNAFKASVNADGTLTEVEILKKLDHPFAPRVVDISENEESIRIVMDYVKGDSLQMVLEKEGAIKQASAAHYMLDVAKLLYYLHKRGIIYRDLKPANIILTEDGGIKVIDFGIAKMVRGGIYTDSVSLGTKGYAAPEQSRRYSDERSDIYALGVTLYQLITGISPVKQGFKVEPLSKCDASLSSGLDEIIRKATSIDPNLRYQSDLELIDALSNYKKLEKPYMAKLKRKVFIGKALRTISCSLITAGILLLGAGVIKDFLTYSSLVETNSLSETERIESYKNAIELSPLRPEAYIKLTNEYRNEGLSMAEAQELMDYYTTFEEKSILETKGYGDAHYALGEAVLVDYMGLSNYESRARLAIAGPYFNIAAKSSERKELSIAVSNIYTFYAAYVSESPGKDSCEALLSSVRGLLLYSDSFIGKGSSKIKLMYYETGIDVLSEYLVKIQSSGVSRDSIRKLGTDIKTKIEGFILEGEDKVLGDSVIAKAENLIARCK